MDKQNLQTRKKIKAMTPLEQLKKATSKILLTDSSKEEVYDHCKDFYFVFDVEITKGRTWDAGTDSAPPTWTSDDEAEITELRVLETVNYLDVELSESELDEIAKELINKIEIE